MSEDSAEDISDEPQTYAITALGAGRPAKGQFSGDRGLFVRMQLRFLLRALFSAGLYHFWAKTKTRRYLWHHAEIAGERL